MLDDGKFRVTLSYAQMAAVLSQESLSPAEILSNRIFGSLRLAGGIVELAGAGVLCAMPEPTMISKVGCVAMGVHASDQLSAGATQILTGKETSSLAFKAGDSAAEMLGATREAGQVIGLATEFAVPLSTASLYNAFRVSSVRAGRLTVNTSEKPLQAARNLGGGHTKLKHIGKNTIYLNSRFTSKKVQVASTFDDLTTAEWAVSKVLHKHRLKIIMYSKARFLLKKDRMQAFEASFDTVVGWGITRNAPSTPISMKKVRVAIRFVEYNYTTS